MLPSRWWEKAAWFKMLKAAWRLGSRLVHSEVHYVLSLSKAWRTSSKAWKSILRRQIMRHVCALIIDHYHQANLPLSIAQVIGSLISAIQDACRTGLLDWSPRLMLAMYTCDIQASSQQSSSHHDFLSVADMPFSRRPGQGLWSCCKAARADRVRRNEGRHDVL